MVRSSTHIQSGLRAYTVSGPRINGPRALQAQGRNAFSIRDLQASTAAPCSAFLYAYRSSCSSGAMHVNRIGRCSALTEPRTLFPKKTTTTIEPNAACRDRGTAMARAKRRRLDHFLGVDVMAVEARWRSARRRHAHRGLSAAPSHQPASLAADLPVHPPGRAVARPGGRVKLMSSIEDAWLN
jgi:hypothetical protein